MDIAQFQDYLASLHKREATEQAIVQACNMAIGAFTGARPWSFAAASTTLTTDANGIITFPDDFDGSITLRERVSSSGGWIQVWSNEKFDFEIPRLDNLTGSYPKACKVYVEDGTWKGQMAPPTASTVVYVTYKRKVTELAEIPEKYLPGITAAANFFMTIPSAPEHGVAALVMGNMIKILWKEDRKSWASIFKTLDEAEVRRYVTWWGTWDAW